MTHPIPPKKKTGEHLEDLRRAIVTSIAAVGLLSLAAWFFSDRLVDWLLEPAKRVVDGPLYFFGPSDAFLIRMYASIAAGIIAASPVIAYQLWTFIAPALYDNEKKSAMPWAAATAGLFVVGCAFGYFFILPTSLQFTMSFATDSLRPMLSVREYLAFASDLVLASGVAFDFPVVIVAAVGMGLVRTATLARFRRHAYVVIFVIAAILTPPDISSQLLLGLPMLALFEGSLLTAKLLEKTRRPARP
jgi:sec-independent protein translocase protein TatC